LGKKPPNGVRYPLVGGMSGRHFAGTNFKPHKRLENAHTAPHTLCGVHAARCVGPHNTIIAYFLNGSSNFQNRSPYVTMKSTRDENSH